MSKVKFDGDNRLIYVISESIDIDIKPDVYSEWKRWMLTGSNAAYDQAIRTVGGDPISITLELGDTYFLMNGWQLRGFDGTYQVQLNGNLYHDDGIFIAVPPTGSDSNVMLRLQTSNLIQTNIIQQPEILEIQTDVTYISESIGTIALDPESSASIANIENQTTDISQSLVEHRLETEDRIKYILGLSQQNFRMKDQIYDLSTNMVTATVRI